MNHSLSDGISLMKNLGLSSDSEDSDDKIDPFEVKVRPKNVGVSASISNKEQKEIRYIEPSGLWRKDFHKKQIDYDPENIGDEENGFCTVPICKNFQQSLVKFHRRAQRAESHRLQLKQDISNAEERIKILKYEITHAKESDQNKAKLIEIISSLNESDFDFDKAIQICIIIATDQTVIDPEKGKKYYTKKKRDKNEINPKKLSFSIVSTYLKPLILNIDPDDLHFDKWAQARDWIDSVGMSIDKTLLWDDFLKHKIFPSFHALICDDEQGSYKVTELLKGLYHTAIITQQSVLQFFHFTGRPFIVKNLKQLCQTRDILYWIDIAQTVNISDQFANIILEYATKILKKWNPLDRKDDKIIQDMLNQWPHVLGNSLDFFYHTIAPKLKDGLKQGHLEVLQMWLPYFPVDLTASLISDFYLNHVYHTIKTIENPRLAAQTYLDSKNKIPDIVINHPKVIQQLIVILDHLKLRNKTISSIRVNSQIARI